jgi:parvulin-like peptidyl-prolyl isomerase
MRNRSPLIATAALAIGLLAGFAGCGGGTKSASGVPSSVAAVVGNERISKAELASQIAITRRQYAVKKMSFPNPGAQDFIVIRDKALTYLVQESELDQKLHALGVAPVTTHDVDARLASVRKKLFGNSESAYTQALANTGLTEADAKAELHDRLVETRLFEHVNAKTSVSELEVRRYYDSHKTQYGRAATRDVRYILVASEALAAKIATQLRDGGDFAALAKRYSVDAASAKAGGAITISQGNSIAELERAAFRLKTGAISQPVHTRYGWSVVQAVGPVHAGKFAPLSTIEGQLRATILKSKKQTRWTAFLAKVRSEFAGSVRYQKGYAPAVP